MRHLVSGFQTSIKGTPVHVEADVPVGDEDSGNLALLGKLSKICPVLETVLSLAIVIC